MYTKRAERFMRADITLKFQCAGCGGYEWGSSRNTDGTLTRYCHTPNCKRQWHEADDYRHFTAGGRRYLSRTQFDRAVYTSKPAVVMGTVIPPKEPPDAA